MMRRFDSLAEEVLAGRAVEVEDALAMVSSTDDELLNLLDGAFRLRRAHFGRGVMLHVIRNAKSGGCQEDCGYCSQSRRATGSVPEYSLQSVEAICDGAKEAYRRKAVRYCIVTSGRLLSDDEMNLVCAAVQRVRDELPLAICTSLGALTQKQADRLKAAGVHRYNHNLETVPRVFREVCSTHTFEDRLATIGAVKSAGMELCSGGIFGMGERLAERVELAFLLRDIDAGAIPVNFFDPRPGTPLAGAPRLRPNEALRILAMLRFVCPNKEIRIAGGREHILGPLQALALYAANSMFTEGYLTTDGQGYTADLALLEAAEFEPTGFAE
jgi:biotin synthase